MKIEAIIVDGKVYDVVNTKEKFDCAQCAFRDDCILDDDCFALWDYKHFERRDARNEH